MTRTWDAKERVAPKHLCQSASETLTAPRWVQVSVAKTAPSGWHDCGFGL